MKDSRIIYDEPEGVLFWRGKLEWYLVEAGLRERFVRGTQTENVTLIWEM